MSKLEQLKQELAAIQAKIEANGKRIQWLKNDNIRIDKEIVGHKQDIIDTNKEIAELKQG